MKKNIPLERDIQLACCEYLELKRHFFWRNNNVGLYDPKTKGYRNFPKHCIKGVPDIIVISDKGQFIGLEIKRPGGKLRDEQEFFRVMSEKKGAQYHLVTDVSQLKEIGL